MVNPSSIRRTARKYLRIFVGRFFRYHFVKPFANLIAFVNSSHKHESTSILELDQILAQASSLDEFLQNKSLLNQYYAGLAGYFGLNRFPRRSFDALVEQIKLVCEKVPGFSSQLWEDQSNRKRAFELVTQGSTSGRSLNFSLWKLYRFDWLTQLRKNFEKHFPETDAIGITTKAKEYFLKLELEVKWLELGLIQAKYGIPQVTGSSRMSKKRTRIMRAEAFKRFTSDPMLDVYASFFLYQHLTSHENRFFFQLSDADLVIDFLKNLKQNQRVIFENISDVVIPSPLMSVVKKHIPNVADLLEDDDLFHVMELNAIGKKQKNSQAVYRTQFLRPFHGIWLGIAGNDCLAGDPTSLDQLTPARWAVSALQGTRTAVIEKNGFYHGFVQCVPVQTEQKEVYGSLELWASVFNNRFIFIDEKTQAKVSMNFFDAWFQKFSDILPRHWKGVIASESRFIDNTGVKKSLFFSPSWTNGKELCHSSELRHMDLLATDISQVVKPRGRAAIYCNEMVFDASISDAGKVRVLRRQEEVENFEAKIHSGAMLVSSSTH